MIFSNNAMSKVLFGHSTILDIHESPYDRHQKKICFYPVENYINLLCDLEQFCFYHNLKDVSVRCLNKKLHLNRGHGSHLGFMYRSADNQARYTP